MVVGTVAERMLTPRTALAMSSDTVRLVSVSMVDAGSTVLMDASTTTEAERKEREMLERGTWTAAAIADWNAAASKSSMVVSMMKDCEMIVGDGGEGDAVCGAGLPTESKMPGARM